jgi:hypothetical protein
MLRVVAKVPGGPPALVVVECDCGSPRKTLRASNLARTRSCGCLKAACDERMRRHGMSDTPACKRWLALCGYGILCEFWRADLVAFTEDIGEPPERGMMLRAVDPSRPIGCGQEDCEDCGGAGPNWHWVRKGEPGWRLPGARRRRKGEEIVPPATATEMSAATRAA